MARSVDRLAEDLLARVATAALAHDEMTPRARGVESKPAEVVHGAVNPGNRPPGSTNPDGSTHTRTAADTRVRARRSQRVEDALRLVREAGAVSETDAATQLLELGAGLVLYRAELARTRARRRALVRGDATTVEPGSLSFGSDEAEAMLLRATGRDE